MNQHPEDQDPGLPFPPPGMPEPALSAEAALESPEPWPPPAADERFLHLPTLAQALSLYGLIALLFVLQGLFFALRAPNLGTAAGTDPATLLVTQILLLIAPVVLWSRLFHWDVARTFRLRAVRLPVLIYTAIASLAFIPLAQEVEAIVERFLPVPPFMEEIFRELLTASTPGELALTLAAVAIIPGIIEEALFRGVFLWALLRHVNPRRAVIGTALFFAILHFNPWQFVGGFVLGSIYGVIVLWTGSLLPVILAHMINNAVFVVLTNVWPDVTGPIGMPGRLVLDAAGAVLSLLCLVQIHRSGRGATA